jgi:hypothetical protein
MVHSQPEEMGVMDRELRQRIVDTICEEWQTSSGSDELDSSRIYERPVSEGAQFAESDMQEFMQELVGSGLVRGVIHLGNVRITDVDSDLCEQSLNY